jgi:uncharacterized membrane protein
MKVIRPLLLSTGVVAAMGAASAWAVGRSGDRLVPTHFGLNGPDGFAPASTALWLTPAITLGLAALMAGLPGLMPKTARLDRSAGAYEAVWLSVLVVLAVTHLAIVGAAVGWAFDPTRLIMALVGGLIAVIGNLMGKIRYNYVFGVRTPWTLASERVWDRTHRFMGPWFVAWGLLMIGVALFGPGGTGGRAAFGLVTPACAIAILALACGYSYREARRVGAV